MGKPSISSTLDGLAGVNPQVSQVVNAALSCLLLSFCSISMVLANKALAATYKADLEVLLVAFQCMAAAFMVELSRRFGIVKCEAFNKQIALSWLPIASLFCLMLYTSIMALRYLSVPMITAFKSLANVLIVLGDWKLNKQPVSALIALSIAIMVGGAFLAGWADLTFDLVGYLWMSANCMATASYVLSMKFATKHIDLPKFGMVFYNNLLGFLILLPLAAIKGDLTRFMHNEALHVPMYAFLNVFAGGLGFALNFAALWCVSCNSATTYAVVNTVNNFPLAIIGHVVFSSPISVQQWEYIMFNMLGGMVYSYAKIKEREADAQKESVGIELGDKESVEPLVPKEEQPEA